MMEKHTGTNASETSNHTSGTGSSPVPPTNEGNTAKADPDMDRQTNSDKVQDGDEYGDDMRTRFSEV